MKQPAVSRTLKINQPAIKNNLKSSQRRCPRLQPASSSSPRLLVSFFTVELSAAVRGEEEETARARLSSCRSVKGIHSFSRSQVKGQGELVSAFVSGTRSLK